MAGIMSPPSSFNIILQKGLAAHVERSSSATLATTSGFHASSTSVMAGCASEGDAYGIRSDAPVVSPSSRQVDADVTSSVMVQGRKKRGRPRKYGLDVSVTLGLASNTTAATPKPASPCQKKGRGQPFGFAGTMRGGFTPHMLTIAAGEDIALKIMSLSQLGPRAVCILSANGAISNVRLQQSTTSGGTITYEGYYEILSLSGSFFPNKKSLCVSGQTSGLSVSLAGQDGEIVGGGVAGLLLAASPVQMVIGSFLSSVKKSQLKAAKVEGPQKKDSDLGAAVPVMEPPTQKAMGMQVDDSPLTTTTSTESQQLQNFKHVEVRSFTSLLDVRNDALQFS